MNTPYRVTRDENGNKIESDVVNGYLVKTEFDNRRTRRADKTTPRHRGNNKGISLTVNNGVRYKRIFQSVDGKTIPHYILCKDKAWTGNKYNRKMEEDAC